MFTPSQKICTHSLLVPPHGLVEAISSETVHLPPEILGYAMVKTGFSNEGVLAINIGIIDPSYRGLVATTLINFSRQPFELKKGDSFLRLSFHSMSSPDISAWAPLPDLDASISERNNKLYLEERKTKALRHFSTTFLDIEATAKRAADEAFGKWKSAAFYLVPLVAFLLAVGTFIFNFVAPRLDDKARSELRTECQNYIDRQLKGNSQGSNTGAIQPPMTGSGSGSGSGGHP